MNISTTPKTAAAKSFNRPLKLLGLTAGILILSSGLAGASSYSSSVSLKVGMTLIDPIVLTNLADINLGSLIKPTSGNASYSVSPSGSASSSGGGSFLGTPTAGSLQIKGNSGSAVSITASMGSCNNAGVTLTAVNTTAAPRTLTGSNQIFGVGASVQVAASAPIGLASCNFTVNAAY